MNRIPGNCQVLIATMAIDDIELAEDSDMIALLHAVEAVIRRSGKTRIARWRHLAEDLAMHQARMCEALEDEKAVTA